MSAVLTNPPRLDRLQVENAMAAMSDADWRRVEFIASSLSHGFTGFEPEDLILEAQTKLLEGVRVWPTGVPAVVVLENVMSSIASNARKRIKEGPIDVTVEVDPLETDYQGGVSAGQTVFSRTDATPESQAATREQIAAIDRLVADDADLQDLVAAWAMELKGEEAWMSLGWTKDKYEANRKKLTRRLDKLAFEGSKK
ncbi:hypothetical protein [Thauera aminoaromatica]|uniref:Uncharacterized protein n=1 Tax=Thauera aminoaromatica TaxID=164330 RepID=A0A5C7S738_THASP|nr:hypothetical protein [Thauera aminoaromatica]TXH79507.1 MAG: hypothetical protein E6Q80_20285 [Thauera aminoaromatica]